MDALAALTAVQTGDLPRLLGALDVDEREEIVITLPRVGTVTLVAGRIGALNFGIDHEGTVMIHAHDSQYEASQCLRVQVAKTREEARLASTIMDGADPMAVLGQLLQGGPTQQPEQGFYL